MLPTIRERCKLVPRLRRLLQQRVGFLLKNSDLVGTQQIFEFDEAVPGELFVCGDRIHTASVIQITNLGKRAGASPAGFAISHRKWGPAAG